MSFNVENITDVGVKTKDVLKLGAKEAANLYKKSAPQHKKDFDKAYLQLSNDIDKFNKKWSFLQSRERADELKEQVKELIKYADTFNDPTEIERQNQTWLKSTLSLIDEEGGAYAGDLKNLAIEGYMIASAEGIRLAEDKVRAEATLKLDGYDARFNQAINDGDIQAALDIQQEREAMLNSLVVEDVYNKKEAAAYLKNSREQYTDKMLLKSLEQNELIEVTQNRSAALTDIKKAKTMFQPFMNRASDRVKILFNRRLKALQDNANTNNLTVSQFEYTDTLNAWMMGAATSAEALKESKEYVSAVRQAKKQGLLKQSAIPKADRELQKAKITAKLIEDVGLSGADLANGKPLTNPLLNPAASVDEVMKHYGYAANTPAASIIGELKSKLAFTPNDSVLNRVLLYEFATGAAGLDKDLPDVDSPNSLIRRITREKAVDSLMGGEGNMSSLSADAFREYLKQPGARDIMNVAVAQNPELIYEVAKHRSKPENAATSTRITDFMQLYMPILNVSPTDLSVIHAKLANDGNTQKAYNRIFNYLEEHYGSNKDLIFFAEQENIGRQQLFAAMTASIYNQMSQGLAQTGDADKFLAQSLKRDIGASGVADSAKFLVDAMINKQTNRALVNTTDSPILNENSKQSNLIVSAFSQSAFGIINRIRNIGPDLGVRNVKPLRETEYKQLTNYVESLLDKPVELGTDRLRLMQHSGNVYKLGYINGFGSLTPLRDKENDFIYLNTEIKSKEKGNFEILRDLIIQSNTREYE